MGIISSIFSAIASVFGWARQRGAQENTPAMQANAQAQSIQDVRDKIAADLAKGDGAAVGKDLAP